MNTVNWEEVGSEAYEVLAAEYGTPFYLIDADAVRARIRGIREAFDGRVSVYYAVKANPNLELLRALRNTADGLDISSAGELEQAMLAGYDAARSSFAGPAKTRDELRSAIVQGVGNISIESRRELDDCILVAREVGKAAQVVIRVNPQFLNRAFALKMGGRPVQFGIDEEALPDVLPIIEKSADFLDFHGVHVYAGSQSFDAGAIAEGVSNTLSIVRKIEALSALRCGTVNLGGGFGVSHSKEREELELAELAPRLAPVLDDFRAKSAIERDIVFELGRFLVADAGLYVTRVVSTKTSRGKDFFNCDGGLHQHLSAAGTFGTALRSNFVLLNLSRPTGEPHRCHIAGPSCNPTDLLGNNATVARLRQGDLLGVLKSGAYGLTASPLLFLGRRTPAELVRVDNKIRLGRRSHDVHEFN